jgi:hypothetical protein
VENRVYCGKCIHILQHNTHYPDCIIGHWENTFHGGLPHSEGDDIHLGMSYFKSTESAILKNINYDCRDFEPNPTADKLGKHEK